MSPIFDKHFDWHNSPAHLAFLATFLKPRSLDNHPTDNPWAEVLGEQPEEAVERFRKDEFLVVCSLSETLALQLPNLEEDQLRGLLREKALSTEGKKDDLVLRLVRTQDPLLLEKVPEPTLLRLTDEGRKIVENFLSKGVKMLEGADPQLQASIKKVMNWLVVEIVVGGVIYDVLKAMLAELKLADLPSALPVTPAPLPLPETPPLPETTPSPPTPPAPSPRKPVVPDWIKVPAGYSLNGIKGDHYYLISDELLPRKIKDLGPGLRLEDTGWGTYTVYRIAPKTTPQAEPVSEKEKGKEPASGERRPEVRHATYIEPELVRVGAGEFWMGSAESDPDARDVEKPRHLLHLPEYWIGRYPVTNEEYRLFLAASPEHKKPWDWEGREYPFGKGQHPVVEVSWDDALKYCQWLTKTTGERYTLPSEAEWEKAARGTDGRIYPWGNTWDASRCNCSEAGLKDTTPVGKYSPRGDSPYNCADMAGNVWEWTRSRWGSSWEKPEFKYPYVVNDGREDLNSTDIRLLRGGSSIFLSTPAAPTVTGTTQATGSGTTGSGWSCSHSVSGL